jgi:hypothetical protein
MIGAPKLLYFKIRRPNLQNNKNMEIKTTIKRKLKKEYCFGIQF